MDNPFTLSFGKKPLQYISRISQTAEIIDNFTARQPSNQIYMLTGVRGAGKTVMMSSIANELGKNEDWIVVELNPNRDLLKSLAAKLYTLPEMYPYFIQAKIDLSFFGLGVSLENAVPVISDSSFGNKSVGMIGILQRLDSAIPVQMIR